MKKKRFSVEQMIGLLRQVQVGVPVAEVIRKAGISERTFYRWKCSNTTRRIRTNEFTATGH